MSNTYRPFSFPRFLLSTMLSVVAVLFIWAPTTSAQTRIVDSAMGPVAVPVAPQRVVVLTNEALEAMIQLGIQPVGSVVAGTDVQWLPHLEPYMDGIVPIGTESQVNLELVAALRPDVIIGVRARHESIYPHLSRIAPTVFADTFMGTWRENFLTYADAVNQRDKAEEILAAWDAAAADLSKRLEAAGVLEWEVSVVRFNPGTGPLGGAARYYGNMSFATDIIKRLGFRRPPHHDLDDVFAVGINPEQIPEVDGDAIFYFVMETGTGEATSAAQAWLSQPLWQALRAHKAGRVWEVPDETWNKTYGIVSAFYVLEDIERIVLGEN